MDSNTKPHWVNMTSGSGRGSGNPLVPLKVWWFGRQKHNFGDILTPYIWKAFGVPCRYAEFPDAEGIGIGSILDGASITSKPNQTRALVVWTSGLMHERRLAGDAYKQHRYLAVRGWLTHRLLRLPKSCLVGDGGLLVKEAFLKRHAELPPKEYLLGIVPHYVDHQTVQQIPWVADDSRIKVINILGTVEDVFTQMAQCQAILSSSLHGLIAADSLEIPNRRFVCATSRGIGGQGFKYRDYYSVFTDPSPVTPVQLEGLSSLGDGLQVTQPYSRPGLETIKTQLMQSLAKLPGTIQRARRQTAQIRQRVQASAQRQAARKAAKAAQAAKQAKQAQQVKALQPRAKSTKRRR